MSDYESQTLNDLPLFAGRDHGKQSRDEQYQAIVSELPERELIWLDRIVAVGPLGITLDELSAEYHQSANKFSGRITSLKAKHLVQHTEERRPTRSGGTASVIVACQFLGVGAIS